MAALCPYRVLLLACLMLCEVLIDLLLGRAVFVAAAPVVLVQLRSCPVSHMPPLGASCLPACNIASAKIYTWW